MRLTIFLIDSDKQLNFCLGEMNLLKNTVMGSISSISS